MPLVYVDRSPLHAASVSVLPDNERAGFDATRHLLELGHKRVGIISKPLTLPAGADRLTGYKRALRSQQSAARPHLGYDRQRHSGFRILVRH